MRAVVNLDEVRQFMGKDDFLRKLKMKNIAFNTVKVTYIASIELKVVEVKPTTVTVAYKAGFMKNGLIKMVHHFIQSKIDHTVIHWDTDNKLVEILLHNIPQAKKFFELAELENLTVVDDVITLEVLQR